MTQPRHLRSLSATGRAALKYKCQVAAQANFAGTRDVRVHAVNSIDGANEASSPSGWAKSSSTRRTATP